MVKILRIILLYPIVFGPCHQLELQAQRVIHITSIPINTPSGDQLTLGASANDWNPGNVNWIFSTADGGWYLDVPTTAPTIFQGKVTRGAWATVEGNSGGGFLADRTFNFTNSDTIAISVAGWEGQGGNDLPENLVILDNAFFMPELNRSRRIRVLLPASYDATTDHYPVLYMHDGQNLFSASEAFAGEWEIDEAMAAFEAGGYGGALIVAIDNGGSLRIDEYTPWANPQYGGGEGMEYSAFIANTLKPFVDENYRTLPEAANTGLMGSSLGGLVSHYCGMAYPNVFGKVGVLSPSFWYTDDIYSFTQMEVIGNPNKFYFLAGGQESASLQGQVQSMVDLMESGGMSEDQIRYDFVPNGQHSEWFWAQEFPTAFEWLFMSAPLGENGRDELEELELFPNPASDTITLRGINSQEYSVEIFDLAGRSFGEFRTIGGQLAIADLAKGVYRLVVSQGDFATTKTLIKL